ncbi:uncharacterized protein PV09_08140 [Verruconis gallopava]|uniref:Metallo-beta-lactamase domain-containing protein n=1 Tax=Verruconis gallopava TaxID=253628 RepID=A0A0D2AM75_9PEZI|nr:uncharacterized protein PV09_08140 [Verruconis gallopava]KIW00249.1 hypothetical protein PV09_08140 [Verruconis gallopava]
MGDFIAAEPLPSTCFTCTRLNSTTFRIVEEDRFGEYPFIYVKVTPRALVLIDTGCGGEAKEPRVELKRLRDFLEVYPVEENGDAPLNEGASKDYVVICTHCHFDHIGACEQFTDARSCIWASGFDKTFLSRENLPTSSLSRFLGVETPRYEIGKWAGDGDCVTYDGEDLGLITYQTPGHVPDELAIWDPHERVLYVGDSVYEWAAILFPKEGDLLLYSDSIGKLRRLVKGWSGEGSAERRRVKMACGHVTLDADAETALADLDAFLWDVVCGRVEGGGMENIRGEENVLYVREDGRWSIKGPRRLFDDLKGNQEAMKKLERRVNEGV